MVRREVEGLEDVMVVLYLGAFLEDVVVVLDLGAFRQGIALLAEDGDDLLAGDGYGMACAQLEVVARHGHVG